MSFNTDKTVEVIFSWENAEPHHPILQLGSDEIKALSELAALAVTGALKGTCRQRFSEELGRQTL